MTVKGPTGTMQTGSEPLIIDTGDNNWVRAVFAILGAGIICVVIYELGRGVWPPNIASPFFLFMILGACTVGKPLIFGSLFGEAARWEVTPGLITIHLKNPFRQRVMRLRPGNVLALSVVEREAMEGDNTWFVELTTASERFSTPDFGTRARAEQQRLEIERAFARAARE